MQVPTGTGTGTGTDEADTDSDVKQQKTKRAAQDQQLFLNRLQLEGDYCLV
jgi:hypothetical protein